MDTVVLEDKQQQETVEEEVIVDLGTEQPVDDKNLTENINENEQINSTTDSSSISVEIIEKPSTISSSKGASSKFVTKFSSTVLKMTSSMKETVSNVILPAMPNMASVSNLLGVGRTPNRTISSTKVLYEKGEYKQQQHEQRIREQKQKAKLVYNIGSIKRARKRVLVTGGAGFIGSHLIDRLMSMNCDVICVDNLYSGQKSNLYKWFSNVHFEFLRHDVCEPLMVEVDEIYHLACPASPVFYQRNPIKTIKTCFLGTLNMLGLAKRVNARILLTSTSEVYGDPLVHPQPETYWGNVNPIGIRSCYDEGKRIAETLMMDYHRQNNVNIAIARIFNTYGPRMLENDGRVVSNFIVQALQGQQLTIYGDGSQTRSFCYIDDQVDGLVKLMESTEIGPINIGNPDEYSIKQLAKCVTQIVNKKMGSKHTGYAYKDLPSDDPKRRKPDITKARELLHWNANIDLMTGLEATIDYFADYLEITRDENENKESVVNENIQHFLGGLSECTVDANVHALCKKFRNEVESLVRNDDNNKAIISEFKAVGVREQVVAGINYFIKVRVNSNGDCCHLRVWSKLDNSSVLSAVRFGFNETDDILYFDKSK